MLEAVGQLGRRDALVLDQPQQQAGVDAARPRRHHQALERREAHRGVDRASARDGGQRRARAEMAGHDAQVSSVGPEQLGGPPRGVRVREPVEAVTGAAATRPRQRVGGGRGRERRVERGVEARGGRDVRQVAARRRRSRRARAAGAAARGRSGPRCRARTSSSIHVGRPVRLAAVHDAVARRRPASGRPCERAGGKRLAARPRQLAPAERCGRRRRAPTASGCSSPR